MSFFLSIESRMTVEARHAWRQIQGACRRGCAPPSFLFLSSLRTRGSSIVVFVFVFPLSVILALVLFLSSSTLVIEDPVSLSLSFLFLSSLRTRGSSVVLFAKTGRSKDPGSPIESGMTEGRKQRHQMAPPPGACRRGCAAVPNLVGGRGLFERSEFRSPNHSGLRQRHPKGRAWAPMVLGPFAETKEPVLSRAKEPRRAGAKPREHSLSSSRGDTPQPFLSFPTDRESSLFHFHFFCIRTRRIKSHAALHPSRFLPATRRKICQFPT